MPEWTTERLLRLDNAQVALLASAVVAGGVAVAQAQSRAEPDEETLNRAKVFKDWLDKNAEFSPHPLQKWSR